jgi:hypothetical protein
MEHMILMLIAFALGMVAREYFARPQDVLSTEARQLAAAMRETEVTAEYYDGVYTVYANGARVIRYFSGLRVRLMLDCGYTLAYCGQHSASF